MELKFIPDKTYYDEIATPFITDRVYDQKKVLTIPYIIQILNEKYEFDYDYKTIYSLLSTLNTVGDENQKVYSYILHNLEETTRISRWLYDYNLGHEIEKYEYHSKDEKQIKIYKESPQMIFLRAQKKIQQGILGIIDNKNIKYISDTEWVSQLKELYNNEDGKQELNELLKAIQTKFYFDMINLNFLPSSPFLFNQGRYALKNRLEETFIPYFKPIDSMELDDWNIIYSITDQQFGSCYSMGSINDDIKSIYDQSFNQAEIFRNQGGYGVNFSKLRSNYQQVNSIGSKSSGQVSFMEMFNLNTKLIQLHSNTKRGASMFLLDVNHPEILNFINQKTDFDKEYNNLRYANISIVINNKFMDQVYQDNEWITKDPSLYTTNSMLPSELIFKFKQRDIWDNQILNATLHAEPGIINEDSINEDNPLYPEEIITSVNPCVTGDTLVPTNKGLIRADKLEEGMLTWNPIKKQMDKITKVFNNGLKDIYKITLTNGMKLKATKEHKLKTKSGDLVAVEDLSPQDILEISLDDTLQFVEDGSIPQFEQENLGNKNLELKKFRYTNNVDMVWLIGVMVGDGTINADSKKGRYTVTFTIGNTKNGIKTNIERILNDMEVNYRTIETPTSTTQFVVSSKNFCRYIAFLMEIEANEEGKTSTKGNKKIPSWLFKSSKNIFLSFLAGLIDSDGTVNITKKGSNIAVSSIYKEILDSTQQILLSFGIKSSVYKTQNKRDMEDPRNGKIYKAKETWRINFSTLNKKSLAEIYEFMHCSHKKENMKTCIDMGGPNSEYYTSQSKFAKIKSIEHIGQDVVYDITVPGDYMWVTNGFVSLDCAEYLGQDKSVCNLGSINLYQHLSKDGQINEKILKSTIDSLYLFLTLSNFANDFPLPELTETTRRYRNIGMGIMGVQSTFIYKDLPYGSIDSMQVLNDVMKTFNQTQLKDSIYMGNLIGQYDNFDIVKTRLNPDNNATWEYILNNTNKESGITLNNTDQIQNARLLAIQPNGSIGFISNISCGTDTIFSLAYERTVNSGFQSEYKKVQYDQSIYDILRHRYNLTEVQQQVEMEKLGRGEMPDIFNTCNSLSTTSSVGVVEKLQILSMSNRYLDMNTSTTFNIMRDTDLNPNNLEKFTEFNDTILTNQFNSYKKKRFESEQLNILKTNLNSFRQQANYIQVNFASQSEKLTISDLVVKQETDLQAQYKKMSDIEGFKKLSKIIQAVNDFYLLSQILKIKGVTVYVEGSRPPVLKQIRKEEKSERKDTGDKMEFNLDGLSLLLDKKSNKLAPKDVPPYIHRIMKPVKFTTDMNDDGGYRINVEVGFLDDTQEPFEVFFRQTNSIKNLYIDPVEYLDACARLLSWGMRSGADPEYGLTQLGKQKTFDNKYSFISGLLRDEVRDILSYNTLKGKKKKELKDLQEERRKWILTPKGYYVDMEGKHRCPQCGVEIIHHNGCIKCQQCSWSQCTDN